MQKNGYFVCNFNEELWVEGVDHNGFLNHFMVVGDRYLRTGKHF
jgi:hypothetical protein